MTVEEAKAHQKAVMDARNTLNQAIRVAKDAGVHTELEIFQITRERVGALKEYYYTVDAVCTIDPTKLS